MTKFYAARGLMRLVPPMVLLMLAGAFGSVSAQCTDTQIVADIYKLIKADRTLASQISHINIQSLNAAVKYQGYTNKRTEYDRAVGFAAKNGCVKLVNVNDFSPTPPTVDTGQRLGCASGTKQCGDICIPEADVCNIGLFTGSNQLGQPFWMNLFAGNWWISSTDSDF